MPFTTAGESTSAGVSMLNDQRSSPVAKARPSPAARRKAEPGILFVQSVPWSWVTVAGQTKETPNKFYLAPGSYQVTFRTNSGLVKVKHVTVESGKGQKLNEPMDL